MIQNTTFSLNSKCFSMANKDKEHTTRSKMTNLTADKAEFSSKVSFKGQDVSQPTLFERLKARYKKIAAEGNATSNDIKTDERPDLVKTATGETLSILANELLNSRYNNPEDELARKVSKELLIMSRQMAD